MTSAGIEPATFRYVAQHLNHCATAVPTFYLWFVILNWRRKKKQVLESLYAQYWVLLSAFAIHLTWCDIFDVHTAVYRNIISIVKPTRCTNISNLFYFGMTLHVSDGLSVHHQEFKTIHTATDICQTDTAVCLLADSSICLTAVCTVLNSWWWTERPSETCRVSFQNKINLIYWCILLVLLQKLLVWQIQDRLKSSTVVP